MSKQNLASTRIFFLAAIPSLLLGVAPGILAQPSSFNYNISFNGSASLPVSETLKLGSPTDDPTLNVSLTGTGSDIVGNQASPGIYDVSTTLNTTATVTMPTGISATVSSFSATQPYAAGVPSGTDPGLLLQTVVPNSLPITPNAPFYGLFPAPALTDPTGTIAATGVQTVFQFDGHTINLGFDGGADLYYGDSPTESYSNGIYTFTYDDSQLTMAADIGRTDPDVVFNGDVVIQITESAPDSSAGLVGILTLLAVCAGSVWQKARVA